MKKYLYAQKLFDEKLVKEAINYVHEDLENIFKHKDLLQNVLLVCIDKKKMYIYQNEDDCVEINHDEEISEKTLGGWSAILRQGGDLKKYLPEKFLEKDMISGGLYPDFSKIQKKRKTIYTSKQSYIATIIHEYAHVYFNKINPFYYSDKNYNLKVLNLTKDLYLNKKLKKDYEILIPSYINLSEVFAFCVEYEFSKKHAKTHFKNMNEDFLKRIDFLIEEEKEKNLKKEDSALSDPHIYSFVFGKMILEKHGDDWMDRLLKKQSF
jgi:hypothetical protein